MGRQKGDSWVSSAKPKGKPYELRDAANPGLILRVQPSGAKSFVLQWARGRRITLGSPPAMTLERAKTLVAKGLREAKELGAPMPPEGPPAGSLRDFLDEHYEKWAVAHLRTGAALLATLRGQFADFLDRRLADVSVAVVTEYRTKALARSENALSPKSVNNYTQALKGALAKAVEWDMLDRNPLAKLKPLKLDKRGVVRYLTPDEEKKLREALEARDAKLRAERVRFNEWRLARKLEPLPAIPADGFGDHLTPMVLVSLNTGMRYGELSNLSRSAVNFKSGMITIAAAHAKSGQTRHVPMNTECQDVLKRWLRQAGELGIVFKGEGGQRIKSVKTAWGNLLEDAGITEFRWHDLRHSFASKLVMASVDLNTVRELLGHGDLEMTLRYAHLAPDHKAAAVAKLIRA